MSLKANHRVSVTCVYLYMFASVVYDACCARRKSGAEVENVWHTVPLLHSGNQWDCWRPFWLTRHSEEKWRLRSVNVCTCMWSTVLLLIVVFSLHVVFLGRSCLSSNDLLCLFKTLHAVKCLIWTTLTYLLLARCCFMYRFETTLNQYSTTALHSELHTKTNPHLTPSEEPPRPPRFLFLIFFYDPEVWF